MKIYIPSVSPISLKDKLNKLTKLTGEPKIQHKYEIISKENGLIIIENQNIYNIESSFKTNYELIQKYNNIDLLIDRSVNTTISLKSQFPVNYILSKIKLFEFKHNTKSKLSLIIECFEETTNNFELDNIPVNFYFNYESDLLDFNDIFFKEEFNMFLSYLN